MVAEDFADSRPPKISGQVPILPQGPVHRSTVSHSINTTVIRHDKEKRNKACNNCRKSKVKCEKLHPDDDDNRPCKRCSSSRSQCIFEYKIPSYKIVGGGNNENNVINDNLKDATSTIVPITTSQHDMSRKQTSDELKAINNSQGHLNAAGGRTSSDTNQVKAISPGSSISTLLNPVAVQTGANGNQKIDEWENSVENRLQNFDSKLGSILSLLQHQQGIQNEQRLQNNQGFVPQYQLPQTNGVYHASGYQNMNGKRQFIDSSAYQSPQLPPLKRLRSNSPDTMSGSSSSSPPPPLTGPELTLDQVLTKEDAKHLFQYFDSNISPQLFGFAISKYSVEDIWDNCPLLLATICSIASIHHPLLSHLFTGLNTIVHQLSQKVLFHTPRDELEAFNTVLALCFCGFWFQQNQLFTGLALQLAKNMKINSVADFTKKSSSDENEPRSRIPREERLKLWYLLYILDGQQSLVFNRQPLIDGDKDEAVKHSRQLLADEELIPVIGSISQPISKLQEIEDRGSDANATSNKKGVAKPFRPSATSFSNLRLISQVEYNQAITSVFQGDGWDLLTPASFGIPFKSNLELDKWMVQWTVLLSPFNKGSVWSSKSTLIYYNFAKMHINSSAVRNLTMDGDNFTDVEEAFHNDPRVVEELHSDDGSTTGTTTQVDRSSSSEDSEDDSDDDDDDDEKDDNHGPRTRKELSIVESRKVSAKLASGAADTVLNIVLSDPDILAALKYVPIHIHIMLYYAALLVLNPPSDGVSSQSFAEAFESNLKSLKLVKKLKTTVLANSPVDRGFSNKLVEGLTSLLRNKVGSLEKEIMSDEMRDRLASEVMSNESGIFVRSNKSQKISAWPGYDHGHPSKATQS